MRNVPALLALLLLVGALGCEQPNPILPAEPIGKFPVWGQTFNEPASGTKADSLVMGGGAEGPAPSGPGDAQRGGTAVPGKDPMAGAQYGGGDTSTGGALFSQHCALCHGPEGKGGNVMGVVVPTLRDAAWHASISDDQIALTIAHGKGGAGKMPAFIGKLSKDEINHVVAHVRTLKTAE